MARPKRIALRVTTKEEERVKALAAAENISVSDWIRRCILLGSVSTQTNNKASQR